MARSLPDEVNLIEFDAARVRGHADLAVLADWSKRTGTMLAYPDTLSVGDVLRLSNPSVIDAAPFYLRLLYDADWRGRKATAFCEVAYPTRLRWPVVGRLVERSIHPMGGDAELNTTHQSGTARPE